MPEEYWSQFFGLTIKEFLKAGLKVVAHKELLGYNGAYIFKMDQSVVISVPAEIVDSVATRVRLSKNSDIGLTQAFAEQLFDHVERIIGPCYQGYCSNESARLIDNEEVRLLNNSDQVSLENFREQVDEEAWEHSSIAPDKTTFGLFQDDEIIAAACLDMWTENVANIGLVTHPFKRGKGCAKKLCAFATRFGLDKGYEMVYQTLLTNAPAVAVAQSTGYIEYANHLAVRFKTTV
jgi:predicted GNAT family acetyltransferase